MKSKVKEMEDEAEKLRKIQEGIEEQMQSETSCPAFHTKLVEISIHVKDVVQWADILH